MLKTYAHDFVGINRILRGIANLLAYVDEVKRQAPQKHPEDLINPEQAMSEIEETTRKAAALCTELGLRSAYRQLERVAKEIKYYQTDQARVASELAEIAQRIEDDLREAYFLFVPLSKLPFYNAPFYGEEVASRFPECRDDAIEAGRCFALGRHSSVVLHCMGIVQAGLEALAKHLGIKIDVQIE